MRVLNAFSLGMLPETPAEISVEETSAEAAAWMLRRYSVESAVGHADTAAVFSAVLGMEIPCNRVNVVLTKGETALVGQYAGPQLPEGATRLPEGATIRWLLIWVQ